MANETCFERGYWNRVRALAAEGKTYFEKTDEEIMIALDNGEINRIPTAEEVATILEIREEN